MEFLSSITLLSVLFSLALLAALHIRTREYSFLSSAVSDYAIGRSSRLFIVYVVAGMLSYVLLSAMIYSDSRQLFNMKCLFYIGGIVLCRIGLVVFKTDLEGKRLTFPGFLHYLFAIGSFALMFVFLDDTATRLAISPEFGQYRMVWTVYETLVAASLAALCITMIPRLRKVFGLFERIYLILLNVWVGVCAVVIVIRTIAF